MSENRPLFVISFFRISREWNKRKVIHGIEMWTLFLEKLSKKNVGLIINDGGYIYEVQQMKAFD